MKKAVNNLPGKLVALFMGMYGVHVYGQIILFENKGFFLSTFIFQWLIIITIFTFKSTFQQLLAISISQWHKNLIILFIGYLFLLAIINSFSSSTYALLFLVSTIIPGFFLGLVSNINYNNFFILGPFFQKLNTDHIANRLYKLLAIMSLGFVMYEVYLFYVNKLGMALVLTTINNEFYQDLGDYFIIFYCGWLAVREHMRVKKERAERSYFVLSIIVIIEIIVAVLFLQLIGSNKAPLTVVGIGLLYLYFSSEGFLKYRISQLTAIFIILVIGIFSFNKFADPEIITSLRYFSEVESNGFTNNSSTSSRLEQLTSIGVEQLSKNLFIGDISNENYIHSSIVTVQTHTGLIGSILFWLFFWLQGYFIYFKRQDIVLKAVFLPIVFVSVISSAFWWFPLWFLAGLLYVRK